jgi:chromosome segregation ATPase
MEGSLPFLKLRSGGESHTGANYFDIPEGGGGLTSADKAAIQAANAAAASNAAAIQKIKADDAVDFKDLEEETKRLERKFDGRIDRQTTKITNLQSTVDTRFSSANKSIEQVAKAEKAQAKQLTEQRVEAAGERNRIETRVQQAIDAQEGIRTRALENVTARQELDVRLLSAEQTISDQTDTIAELRRELLEVSNAVAALTTPQPPADDS